LPVDFAISSISALLLERLDAWQQTRQASDFPYREAVNCVLSFGKHFLPAVTLCALADAQSIADDVTGTPAEREMLDRFLDTVLDKHTGRYDYSSYIALAVLGHAPGCTENTLPEAAAQTRIAALIGDALAFETGAALGLRTELPLMRPMPDVLAKRLLHGKRILSAMRPDVFPEVTAAADRDLALVHEQLMSLEPHLGQAERARIGLTLLPVYVIHDEYLFIRVLQSFESVFQCLSALASQCIESLDTGKIEEAIASLSAATRLLRSTLPLFSLLATMQKDAFGSFRTYTEGASAIQSVSYKTFESLCRTPERERIESPAFDSVPTVKARALEGSPNIQDSLDSLSAPGLLNDMERASILEALTRLEEVHRRWKRTHYRLAIRMLGNAPGTGYTEGTPYLKSVMSYDLFRSSPESMT
jgi:tryptophan 2,3-dioxygenase